MQIKTEPDMPWQLLLLAAVAIDAVSFLWGEDAALDRIEARDAQIRMAEYCLQPGAIETLCEGAAYVKKGQ